MILGLHQSTACLCLGLFWAFTIYVIKILKQILTSTEIKKEINFIGMYIFRPRSVLKQNLPTRSLHSLFFSINPYKNSYKLKNEKSLFYFVLDYFFAKTSCQATNRVVNQSRNLSFALFTRKQKRIHNTLIDLLV